MAPAERWAELDAANAWSDAIAIWFDDDMPYFSPTNGFTLSLFNTYHITKTANCRQTAPEGNCNTPLVCADLKGFGQGTGGSGTAAMVVYEAITVINSVSLARPPL